MINKFMISFLSQNICFIDFPGYELGDDNAKVGELWGEILKKLELLHKIDLENLKNFDEVIYKLKYSN